MPRLKFTPAEVDKNLVLLEENAQRIHGCMAGCDEKRLKAVPQEGRWSAADILVHLRACAEVWSNSVYTMLAVENPNLPDIHPRRWVKVRDYELLDVHESLRAFILQRQELLVVLRGLPEASWNKTAVIGTRTHSVFSQVRCMAKHESEHCEQIKGLLACEDEKPSGR